MQLNGKKDRGGNSRRPAQVQPGSGVSLADLRLGEHAVISGFNLPEEFAKRLMELGFLPGGQVRASRSAPGGDPRVFEVDGSEIALRGETARQIRIEQAVRQ